MINRIIKISFPFILLLLSISIIFYQFPHLPKYLAFDEVEFAKLALSLDGKPYIAYSPLATGHSTLYFYIILLSFKLFGITQFALRLPSAVSGIFSGILFYYVVNKIFKHESIAFAAAIILIISRWFFGFARFAFEPTFLLFLELVSLYFFISWLRHPKGDWKLILAGIFSGLAFNSYTPGRIFFLLPIFLLIIFFCRKKISHFINFTTLKTFLYFLIPFMILAAPLQYYLFFHQDTRIYQLSFLQNSKLSIQQKTSFFAENIGSTLSMFILKGDPNGKHNYPYKPALNPIIGLFTLVGIGIAFKNWRNRYNLFFILYSLFSILPTLLVYPWENPSMLRTYTVIPAVAYFSGLPFLYASHIKPHIKKNVIIGVMSLLILISSIYELRTYFIYQSKVFKQSFEIKKDLKFIVNCPDVIKCNQ